MADRYWVGGTGTWNTTSTTNWSTTSGGTGGASVPTVADNVFFDQAGTYTVTMTGALNCLDITVSLGAVTFATGTSPTLNVRGSMSLVAGTVWSSTGTITFSSTTTGRTITTNGAFSATDFIFDGVGGEWTLGSAINLGNTNLTITRGTLNSGNYAISCGNLSSNNSNVRTINLGSSTVTITGGFGLFFNTTTNLTFNAGTSQINFTSPAASPQIQSSGVTFSNVAFTSTASGTKIIIGTNTFDNLSVTGPASAGVTTLTFNAQQTINGTLSTTGTAGNRRVFFTTATYGISQDLVVNSAPSLTDADFRGLYVRGTAAPISGTRIGNRGECQGITFDAPKTVYWNLAGSQNWNANGWAATSTGAPSTDYFPLPQDTSTFTDAGSVTSISAGTTNPYLPTVDMSGRTIALTFNINASVPVYGSWTNGSGITFSGTSTLTFSGGTTQTITSAGKTFTCPIIVDTYGGAVELAAALNIGTRTLTVNQGTFDTKNYNVTAGAIDSSNSVVRKIILGSSNITLSGIYPINFFSPTNLYFDAGTSSITFTGNGANGDLGSQSFYNLTYTNPNSSTLSITGSNSFNNLTINPPSIGISTATFSSNQTINGTLTCAGASVIRRIFIRSDTPGTQRTLTVNSISATDCDFRDINLSGTASGASPTRAGDCGGNSGITFPAPKTVYWNLAGTQNWSATGWATSSAGTPALNNFPLAQDTAVFDDAGSAGTITLNSFWNIGTFDASLRTSGMTLSTATNPVVVYGDWKFGTGVFSASTTGTISFSKNGTQIITNNGVWFGCPVTVNNPFGIVQLADAITLQAIRTLTLTRGTFDAVTYNVTAGAYISSSGTTTKMGSGTWTLSGTGTVWTGAGNNVAGTSTIVLSNTTTTARTFAGGGLYYNKLTIGGSTGTSVLTITGSNSFGELASTKTVAHTITLPSSVTTTIGKWSVSGTSGNVVSVTPSTVLTPYTLSIAGPAVTGVDYLFVGYCDISTISPGEFYAGANSTDAGGNTGPIFFTAAPTPRTLYWVGGTGNWSSTTKWSTSSGGSSGAAIPTSLDAVVFDSSSNGTSYTATVDAGVTLARCASFTMAGPATGTLTFAGTVGIAFHGNVSLTSTGISRTNNGTWYLAGNGSYTLTTNGVSFGTTTTVIGIGATWTLGSALTVLNALNINYGTLNTSVSNYAVSCGFLNANNTAVRGLVLNGSTVTVTSSSPSVNFATPENFSFDAGTSQINITLIAGNLAGGGVTFYNVSFTSASASSFTITGKNTFNALSFASRTGSPGITPVTFDSNQTIGTLTLNGGTDARYRTFLASNTIGTQRTLTVSTLFAGAADYDFRDIAVTGTAAPFTGTRFGDCKGNSGITFPAAKTVYWVGNSANWNGSLVWSNVNTAGTGNNIYFPLAQDTATIGSVPTSGSTATINVGYNIGTIDMSARTSNTMTLTTSTNAPVIYGNWINGTGTTVGGTGTITFAGRGSQTITSEGKSFGQQITVNTPNGSVTLQDNFLSSSSSTGLSLTAGTFDANGFDVDLITATFSSTGTTTRTLAIGSGTWSTQASGTAWVASPTGLTVTGTGTISMTSGASKTFAGGGASYAGVTLEHNGPGTLTITGSNIFKTIKTGIFAFTGGSTTIALGATTQTLTNPWMATGEIGNTLTVSGTSAASPATLIFSGAGTAASVDFLNISNVRAYDLSNEWYAGLNSTNLGSLGWYFSAAPSVVSAAGNFFLLFFPT